MKIGKSPKLAKFPNYLKLAIVVYSGESVGLLPNGFTSHRKRQTLCCILRKFQYGRFWEIRNLLRLCVLVILIWIKIHIVKRVPIPRRFSIPTIVMSNLPTRLGCTSGITAVRVRSSSNGRRRCTQPSGVLLLLLERQQPPSKERGRLLLRERER
jgi:hypothetical protein